MTAARVAAEHACRAALADRPKLLADFTALLQVGQRYAVIREQQAGDLTLGWPLLRRCAHRLGEHLVVAGAVTARDDIFFLTHDEVSSTRAGARPGRVVPQRRTDWERHRRLAAPLTLGTPPRLIGDPIAKAVLAARGTHPVPAGGRFAVSDVIADPNMDGANRADSQQWTGCIADALTRQQFQQALSDAGLVDVEITETHRVDEHAAAAIIHARTPTAPGH